MELKSSLAVCVRVDGKPINSDADDLDVTAGWGHAGQGGVTMPGRGRIEETLNAQRPTFTAQCSRRLERSAQQSWRMLWFLVFRVCHRVMFWYTIAIPTFHAMLWFGLAHESALRPIQCEAEIPGDRPGRLGAFEGLIEQGRLRREP
jgi:hypothetical protein